MSEGPINPDREQQRADNIASRRQSGLEPMPKDREEGDEAPGSDDRDEIRRRIEASSGGEPVAGLKAEKEAEEDQQGASG